MDNTYTKRKAQNLEVNTINKYWNRETLPRKKGKQKISTERKILAGILIILTALVGFDLLTNMFDWQINPLNSQSTLKLGMTYTQFYVEYPPNAIEIYKLPNGTATTDVMFSIVVTAVYNTTLVVGDPVYINAWGSLLPKGQQIISQVLVGYQSASYYSPYISDVVTEFPANLSKMNQDPYVRPYWIPDVNNLTNFNNPIKWTSEGDYYPYVQIVFFNGTMTNYPVNMGNLYVNGLDTIQQQQNNLQQSDSTRRTNWIIVDLFLVPVMLGIIAFVLKVKIKEYI